MFESRLINGYSNHYWNLGGEDEDLTRRMRYKSLELRRRDSDLGEYRIQHHMTWDGSEETGDGVLELLRKSIPRLPSDGLNTKVWRVSNFTRAKLFTHVFVGVM